MSILNFFLYSHSQTIRTFFFSIRLSAAFQVSTTRRNRNKPWKGSFVCLPQQKPIHSVACRISDGNAEIEWELSATPARLKYVVWEQKYGYVNINMKSAYMQYILLSHIHSACSHSHHSWIACYFLLFRRWDDEKEKKNTHNICSFWSLLWQHIFTSRRCQRCCWRLFFSSDSKKEKRISFLHSFVHLNEVQQWRKQQQPKMKTLIIRSNMPI